MIKNLLSRLGLLLVLVLILTSMFTFVPTPAKAASNNARMMDDAVFDNAGTMSANDIQGFLNQFPNSCLKNYYDEYPNDYFSYGGNVSAAQAIRRVSDLWGINPRVILTKLEQEENLVTGNAGCALWKYVSAVGFNCPGPTRDATFRGTPVTTCVQQDQNMGFSRQITKGGWLLKFAKERANDNLNWLVPDDASVYYNGPFVTAGNHKHCGSCSVIYSDGTFQGVDIVTGATASFYNYTPYLNQSFDDIYTGWFGPPYYTDICAESTNVPTGFTPTSVGVLAQGANGELNCRYYSSGWGAYKQLAGYITDSPSVVSIAPGIYDVFVRGGNGALYHRRFDKVWGPYENLGGYLKTGPAAVTLGGGVIDVYVQGGNDGLYHRRYWSQGWTAWESLGGTITHAPGVMSISNGIEDVFVRGGNGELYHRRLYSGGWQPWEFLGGPMKSGPVATSLDGSTIDVFAQSNSDSLVHRKYQGGWQAWEDLGGTLSAAPGVISISNGIEDVFTRTGSGTLGHRRYLGGWQAWEDLGGATIQNSPAPFK